MRKLCATSDQAEIERKLEISVVRVERAPAGCAWIELQERSARLPEDVVPVPDERMGCDRLHDVRPDLQPPSQRRVAAEECKDRILRAVGGEGSSGDERADQDHDGGHQRQRAPPIRRERDDHGDRADEQRQECGCRARRGELGQAQEPAGPEERR